MSKDLIVGANVGAIIPASLDEIWRVAGMVVMGGLAPAALVKGKTGDDAISAVSICIMSGAELGLPPMVALRSFTVINGKPALYGDGLINVVRRSGKAEYIRTGYDATKQIGWCEAKRLDTKEDKRVEFSVEEAKRAGLWDERTKVKRKKWNSNDYEEVANDAPWYRYPQRMMGWRAAGYFLRELFADVLGGIADETEALEAAGEPRDVTPVTDTPKPTPPKPKSKKEPAPEKAEEESKVIDHEEAKAEPVEERDPEEQGDSDPQEGADSEKPFDLTEYLDEIETALAACSDETTLEEAWNELDAEAVLQGRDDDAAIALAIYKRNRKRIKDQAK